MQPSTPSLTHPTSFICPTNAGETGLVAGVEIGAKEAMYPAFEVASKALGEEIAKGLIEQTATLAAEAALAGALPFVGALISAACMPHAYKSLARC